LLYTGAFIQALFFVVYPRRVVALPVLLVIAYLVSKNLFLRWGLIRDPSFDRIQGRMTAQIVDKDGTVPKNGCDKEIVVFLLGTCTNE
jgi:hypothetical protein